MPPQDRVLIRDVEPHTPDADELAALVEASWGAPVISRGRAHDVRGLAGLLAERDGEVVGALTYEMRDGEMGSSPSKRSMPTRGWAPGCWRRRGRWRWRRVVAGCG